jgi:type IV secretion system protein VirB10
MDGPVQPSGPPRPKENPEALALRGRPLPAVRFRRGLILGLTGAVCAGLILLAWLALEPPSFREAASALERDEQPRTAEPDSLADVPRTYGDVPRLGPPLPGDLGRPILEQQRAVDEQPAADAMSGADTVRSAEQAARERAAAEREAAARSALMVQLERAASPNASLAAPSAAPEAADAAGRAMALAGVSAAQQRKIDFARSPDGDRNPHALQAPVSPWTLSVGTIIPASLITGLDSDLPGMVVAQVSANVRDSATGRTILIPQGARLVGRYDSAIAYGQRRAMLLWDRIIFPDGASIALDNMPGTDSAGYAGLADRVDGHTWQLLKGIALSTLLGVSAQLTIGGDGALVRAIRESTQQNAAHAGDRITSLNLDVQPTIRVRPGWPVRVLLNKDLVLQPWRG